MKENSSLAKDARTTGVMAAEKAVNPTAGPWHACHDGQCSCGQIWSVPFDAPIAVVKSGAWGDTYPALRHVDASEGMSGTGLKVEAYMEMIEYGSISESAAIAIRRLIAAAPGLLAALEHQLERHIAMVESGDCGNWNVDEDVDVIAMRAAIAKAVQPVEASKEEREARAPQIEHPK